MSIWFVTPAWKRYELTDVCLEQRQYVMEDLARRGIESHCVVIANDENLDIAREWCMDTVEQNNTWLGRKFNDGIEYAAKQGATWIVPIGSDSWIDPNYFLPLPEDSPRIVRTSQLYAPVEADRLAITRVAHRRNPAGPHMFPASLLRRVDYRPMPNKIDRGTDSHTVRRLWPFRWEYKDVHDLQYIGFRVPPYITQYDRLWELWGVREDLDPWNSLKKHYPSDLVDKAMILTRDAAMSVAAG